MAFGREAFARRDAACVSKDPAAFRLFGSGSQSSMLDATGVSRLTPWADGCQTGCRGAAAAAGGKDRCPPTHAARETLLVGATRTFMCFGARYNVYSRLAAATEGLRAASLLRFSICDCSGAARTLGRLQPLGARCPVMRRP